VTQFSVAQTQDKVKVFAHAIARTEGFYVKNTIPNRTHNPGDLTELAHGAVYPGQVGVLRKNHMAYVRFRDNAAGYAALYHQIEKMLNGKSKFYTQTMTLQQVGKLYAGNSRLWAKNLSYCLGVSSSTTLEDYFELPPQVKFEIKPYPLGDSMKIGIDLDDVCSDFQSSYVKLLNKMFGKPPIGTALVDWEGSNLQLNAEETKQSWEEVAKVPDFWAMLNPLVSFDKETIELLNTAHYRHDVFFITNRFATPGDSPLKQTKYWLRANADISAPNVIIAKDKGPVATMLELNAFADDRPKNVVDVQMARPSAKVYLVDSSHNQPFTSTIIPRVKNLKEFLKLILEAN
jgi:5'(3')-deoxyribonucleotidase